METESTGILTTFLILIILPLVIVVQYFVGMVVINRTQKKDLDDSYVNYFKTWLVGFAVVAVITAILWVLYQLFMPKTYM